MQQNLTAHTEKADVQNIRYTVAYFGSVELYILDSGQVAVKAVFDAGHVFEPFGAVVRPKFCGHVKSHD